MVDQGTTSKMIANANGNKMKAEKVGKLGSCVIQYNSRNLKLHLKMLVCA
jgi:hypothetical protein